MTDELVKGIIDVSKKAVDDADLISDCVKKHGKHQIRKTGKTEIIGENIFRRCKWCPLWLPIRNEGIRG